MAEYDDKSYYEIQLEQKQLVLILMLMVAICVLFFFLGVYYVKGREPMQATAPRPTAAPTEGATPATSATPEHADANPRFFEDNAGKGAAPKEDYEGKVLAESLPTDLPPRPGKGDGKGEPKGEPKGESKEKPTPKASASPAPTATARAAATPSPEPTRVAPPPDRAGAASNDGGASASGKFVVQVAAMKDEARAQEMMGKLKSLGFHAYIKTESGADAPFKIRVGPYAERDKAVEAKDRLRSEGHNGAFVSSD